MDLIEKECLVNVNPLKHIPTCLLLLCNNSLNPRLSAGEIGKGVEGWCCASWQLKEVKEFQLEVFGHLKTVLALVV